VPTGTLRRAANYPDAGESRSREDIEMASRHVGSILRSIASTMRRLGTTRSRAPRSIAFPSPAFSSTAPTSLCAMRPPPHSAYAAGLQAAVGDHVDQRRGGAVSSAA
jgi:hypothetical protein